MLKHAISWSDIPGFFDFEEIYDEVVLGAVDGQHFVEVGSCWGRSIAFLCWKLKKLGKQVQIDCVDIWENDTLKVFDWYLYKANFRKMVNRVHCDSVSASRQYEDESVDFIFIDADHSYSGVIADLNAWYPKLKKGCLFAGHDYNSDWPGVVRAVDDFFSGQAIKRGNSWTIIKN